MEPEHEQLKSAFEQAKSQRTALEETLREITAQKDEAETALTALEPEHEQLKSAFEQAKSQRTALEETLREITAQKDEAEMALTALEPEHEQLKSAFEQAKSQRTALEETLREITAQKDRAETALTALEPEHEQLKSAFEAEKNRSISAEKEYQALTQVKAQTEEDLTRKITALDEVLLQREADLNLLKEELETEKRERTSGEELVRSLARDRDQSELSLQSAIGELREQLAALQEQNRSAAAALENKESTIQSLEKNLAESVADKEKAGEVARANQVLYDATLTQLNQDLAEANGIRSVLESDLAGIKQQNLEYTEGVAQATRDKEQAGQQVQSLTAELERLKEAHSSSEGLISSLRIDLADAILEKENTEARVRTDLESYKTTFVRLKRDLDETLVSRRTLEKDLAAAKTQSMEYAEELAVANRNKEQSGQKIHQLAGELERVKADLGVERKLHQATDENREAIELARQRFEQDLRLSADEQKSLTVQLENERKLRLIAEDKVNSSVLEEQRLKEELRAVTEEHGHQEQDRAQKIQTLKKDLETVCDLQKSLEEEVSILNEEKLKAEKNVQALTSELEQARVALADEWENHMTSDEQLAAAVLERERLRQSLLQPDQPDARIEGVQGIIAKEPDLPVIVDSSSHALELVTSPVASPVSDEKGGSQEPSSEPAMEIPEMGTKSVNFSGIEDLFEENEDLSRPGIDSEVTEGGNEEELPPGPAAPDAGEEEPEDEDAGYDETEPEEPGPEFMVPGDFSRPSIGPAFSVNRRQWLGLIKWAHHSEALSRDQRSQILRMGRLLRKNQRLTQEQEDQVREMITLAQALGYRPV